MSVRLYVGNLPKESIEREALQEVFAEANAVVSTKVIKDRKTGKCRGFAFVTVSTDEAADEFIEKYNGQSFMDSPLKIEKANPPREKGDEESGASTDKVKRNDKKRSSKGKVVSSGSEGFQPDPRWADQLAQLKEKLAAAKS